MNDPFTYICCAVPNQADGVRRVPTAHMAWGIGPGLTLLSAGASVPRHGGLMVISDQAYDRSEGDPRRLAQECVYLCRSLGFSGIVCDFEQPVRRLLQTFVTECAELFPARGCAVYAPERYACHNTLRIILPTALTSGSLPNRIKQAVGQYGANRVVLDMERLSRDLLLPGSNSNGVSVSPDTVALLLSSRGGTSFFSGELGARYFTYKDAEQNTHFVVYDDAGTFRYKTELALQLGVREGFILYPDMLGLGLL
ncbi:MAG: hypothetical protein LBR76_06450 [Oscillospiraceae bacterium]|jgi:hypothetical protein|nr:hypothetical protein [Oscillospiraceae bacterium]